MADTPFDRRANESASQWVVRLHLDPWFEEASPVELADFTGLRIEVVQAALRQWASSVRVRRIHQHATQIAESIDWPGTPDALIHLALERYAQRFEGRQKKSGEGSTLDEEIRAFLLEHMTPTSVSA